jgi:DNA-binding LytR/AlgR family response regulator
LELIETKEAFDKKNYGRRENNTEALTILNDDFIQIQNSFIVNFKKINSINSDYVIIGDTEITIGLQFNKVLLDKMKTSLIPQKV